MSLPATTSAPRQGRAFFGPIAVDCAMYGGYSLPMASYAAGLLRTRFTLWESTARRYQEWKVFVGRTALLAPVECVD